MNLAIAQNQKKIAPQNYENYEKNSLIYNESLPGLICAKLCI